MCRSPLSSDVSKSGRRTGINVTLMWAVASGDRDCHLLLWLSNTVSTGPSIQVGGVEMSGRDAVFASWDGSRTEQWPEMHGVQFWNQCMCRSRCKLAWSVVAMRALPHQRTTISGITRATAEFAVADVGRWNLQELCQRRFRVCKRARVWKHDTVREHGNSFVWCLFCFCENHGHLSREDLCDRFDKFTRGEWRDTVRPEGTRARARGRSVARIAEDFHALQHRRRQEEVRET